ncbi:MAG: protein-L-isoaspartate(D-aspartate) O-methyltransferase [Calditrichaeota bacterium]|nr:MAG: protein-L-isoaspartate(D-aspartate) O-methyltransferase [Calditrichota bacterium]
MVKNQIVRRGVQTPRLLEALEKVPRHLFVPHRLEDRAYNDEPLPIGMNQTISQPFIVAYMIDQLHLTGEEKVLEIGTGSGYQTAVLAELAKEVYTIEIIPELSRKAQKKLEELNYQNVFFKIGDGYEGWEEHAPFHAIIVSAAPSYIPPSLIEQLAVGGRMILPVGVEQQELILLIKHEDRVEKQRKIPVRFVPMTGKARHDIEDEWL